MAKYNTPSRLFDFNSNPPSDGLIAAWNLEDTSDSFGANTLTNNNACTFVSAKVNKGLNINGINQYLSIVDNANISFGAGKKLSIVGWFKLNAIGAETPIIAKWSAAGQREYMVSATTNKLTFSVSNDGTAITSVSSFAGTITTGVFYFFVAWYDGNKLFLELNGNGTLFSTPYTSDIFNGTSELNIGRKQEGAVFTNGLIDAIRLYKHDNRVLTNPERQAIYHNGMGIQYEVNSFITAEQMNRELDQLIALFGGFTDDITPKLSSISNNTALTVKQQGASSLLQCKNNGVIKSEVLTHGQLAIYLPNGTAPIVMPTASAGQINNLDVDLLDDLHHFVFLQTTSVLLSENTEAIDGIPAVNDERNLMIDGTTIIKAFAELDTAGDGSVQITVFWSGGTIAIFSITSPASYAEVALNVTGFTTELFTMRVTGVSWSITAPQDLTLGLISKSIPVS